MKKLKEKAKNWIDEHEVEIKAAGIVIGHSALCLGIGLVVGSLNGKIKEMSIDRGLERCINDGFLVLTRPTDDGTVPKLSTKEWIDATKKHYDI